MITIIDYGMGNLHSVLKAFKRIGINAVVSSDKKEIENATKLVLPGIGHFKKGMDNLKKLGLVESLNKRVMKEKTPILGICLGMQLMTKFSEEGNVKGLGWFDAKTIKFDLDKKFKIPHMGWNNIKIKKENHLFNTLSGKESFYFVHSFYVEPREWKDALTTTVYSKEFVSAIQKDNIIGMQFHPEKSHDAGLQILKNFAGDDNV